MKICIDAGHHGKQNRSPVVPEYYESEMNWKLHLLLKKYLEEYGVEVITTRSKQTTVLGTIARGKKAKGCDLFLSVHSNDYDPESLDYPLVIVPLNGTGDELGRKLTNCIASVMETNQAGRIWTRKKDGGGEWYGVLQGTAAVGVTGLILEHSFHSNTRSAKWLLEERNLDKLARAEADLIAAHYGLQKAKTIYRVQIGAYTVRVNAEKQLAKAKAAGFSDAFIKEDTP